jgi:DnaJ-class molecular chaperone
MILLAKKIVKAVKKAVKKAVTKKVVKKEVVLTDCAACNGRGLETSFSLCKFCHGSGRV